LFSRSLLSEFSLNNRIMQAKAEIVIIGAGGRLGAALARAYREEFDVSGFNHAQLDLGNREQVRARLSSLEFDVLINSAAQTNVDRCETHRDEAFLLNADAPRLMAEICHDRGAKMIHVSTDYVFDGNKPEPYSEEDLAEPISVYGESKREGERQVLSVSDRHLVLRVSWVFGPDRPSFIDNVLERARESEEVAAVADKFSTPTYTLDIAEMLRPVLVAAVVDRGAPVAAVAGPGPAVIDRGYSGVLHFANGGKCSWQEYAQWALDCCHSLGLPMYATRIGALKLSEMKNFVARRPVNSILATKKYEGLSGHKPRSWREAVAEYVRQFYSKS
jgi:dTDP-4-dehydrorhamnose reductase